MRILVTGGAGYIGSRLCAHFLNNGADVSVYDSLVYGAPGLLPFMGNPRFRVILGDIRDVQTFVDAMREADAVIHLAAIVGEQACNLDKEAAYTINRAAAIAAMDIADGLGISRFVFISTCSNYGAAGAGAIVDEQSPLDPLSIYAESKVAAEQAALAVNRKAAVTVLRLGTICGLSGRMRFDLLINDMARAAALGHPIEIYKPQAWRPYLHVADVGRIVETVLHAPAHKVRGRVFNVVAENHQKTSLVELVRRHFPKTKIRIIEAAADNRDYRVSAELVRAELGFHAEHTIEEAFLDVARAVRDGVFVDPMWPGFSAVPLEAATSG